MNPTGMFSEGQRQREYSTKDMLPMSGKLIPEFDGRRNIRDMFTRKPSVQQSASNETPSAMSTAGFSAPNAETAEVEDQLPATTPAPPGTGASTSPKASSTTSSTGKKRPLTEASSIKPLKRSKSGSTAVALAASSKGQQSLKGFFKPKASTSNGTALGGTQEGEQLPTANSKAEPVTRTLLPAAEMLQTFTGNTVPLQPPARNSTLSTSPAAQTPKTGAHGTQPMKASPSPSKNTPANTKSPIHDPIVSKESWSKLFTKPVAPRCEGHDEPCITLLTKKSGMNCGRSFWMCPRPLGPSGAKERGTQWRCQTFIWCSDWNPGPA